MESLATLIQQLESEGEEERRQAVVGLALYPLTDVKNSLFKALGDGNWRVRKEAVDVFLKQFPGDEVVKDLTSLLKMPDNAGLRNSVVEILQVLGDKSLPHLFAMLDDQDEGVRKFVVDILSGIGSYTAVPYLLKKLDDEDTNVAAAAAESLGCIGSPDAVTALIAALDKDDLLLRFSVLEALTKLGRRVSLDVLTKLASQPLLKRAVFDCLRGIGSVDAIPLLLEGLGDRAKNVREAAIHALAKVYQRSVGRDTDKECRRLLSEQAGTTRLDAIINSLGSGDPQLKKSAITLLGLIGDQKAIPSLLQECRNEAFYDVCLQAFRDLGEIGVKQLIDQFSDSDDEVRCLIVHLCGEVRGAAIDSFLASALRDRFPMVRKFAVESVGKAKVVTLVNDIALLLDDPSSEVRQSVVNALARLTNAAAETVDVIATRLVESDQVQKRLEGIRLLGALADYERLSLMAKDVEPNVRRSAISSLGNLRNPASISAISLALTDEEPDVRVAAATALGQVGGTDALNTLLMVLGDEHPWVQVAALKSLSRMSDPSSLPAVKSILKSVTGIVLITALETLAGIGGADAVPTLIEATGNNDVEIVKMALDLLSRFPDGWVQEVGERLLTHEDRDIRRKVAKVLADRKKKAALPLLERAAVNETDDTVRRYLLDLADTVR